MGRRLRYTQSWGDGHQQKGIQSGLCQVIQEYGIAPLLSSQRTVLAATVYGSLETLLGLTVTMMQPSPLCGPWRIGSCQQMSSTGG